jgi:hypothetical protein
MKTDDYKQELRISATLRRTNAKKIFLHSKNQLLSILTFVFLF